MLLEAVYHSTYSEYSHAIDENTVIIRLRASKSDIKKCYVCYGDRVYPGNPIKVETVEMRLVASDRLFDYFEAEICTRFTRVCYYFVLYDGKRSVFYYNNDFHDTLTAERQMYFQLHYIRQEDIARVPDWSKHVVIYQIFPDSFATSKGELSGNCLEIPVDKGIFSKNRLGGNLNGIMENIPYMTELGINCIYLNPIFTACSYHKYDTTDYYSVDPCFGSNETLKELVSKCHEANIRVILDGVFNHSGTGFFAFRDVLEKGEESRHKDWFYIKDFPVRCEDPPNYECFAYARCMPKLNTGNREVRDFLIDVGTFWVKEADIDGWRLDVADEINHDFWREFRKAVKAVKPDVFLIGEVWDGSKAFLQGDQFDSLMNYNLTYVCIDFFAKRIINVEQFDARVNHLLMRYKKNIQYAQMNLLCSHDVPRFLALCGGDVRKLKLAALFLMTHVGIPTVYYGDEKGLSGTGRGEEFREPMPWQDDDQSRDIFDYYKKLIAIRKQYMPLMLGDYTTIEADIGKNVYVFSRGTGEGKLIVAINNGEYCQTLQIPLYGSKKEVLDLLHNATYAVDNSKVAIELAPLSGTIFEV